MLELQTDCERIALHFTRRRGRHVLVSGSVALLADGLMLRLPPRMDTPMQTASMQVQWMSTTETGMPSPDATFGEDTRRIDVRLPGAVWRPRLFDLIATIVTTRHDIAANGRQPGRPHRMVHRPH
jgi:hypothetical protein